MRDFNRSTVVPKTASLTWLFFLFFLGVSPIAALGATGYDIFLTNRMEDGKPAEERITRFDCSDRIYVVVIVAGLGEGEHELKVRWLDPAGEQRELTRFNFQGARIANHIWAWLQLHGPTGAIIGQMFDPSFGMEEFIGDWRAEVHINNRKVSTQQFQVLC